MKKFEKPIAEIIELNRTDVIVTSGCGFDCPDFCAPVCTTVCQGNEYIGE